VTVTRIDDGRISIDVASGGGFLVLSEQTYPGWRAHIGDTSLVIQRTDLALQGVEVPAGHHLVEFEFAPVSLVVGKVVSGTALVISLALLFTGWRRPGTQAAGVVR
jgi:uncharacterized membrane protein YfhO